MDALELLLSRQSQPRLQAPAPCGIELENIKKAALRAPDHAGLRPWRFIVCEGNGLRKLGEILEQAAIESDMGQKDIDRAPQLPLRAPMVIVAIAKYSAHPKVPWIEQVESAACSVHAMQMAALVQGFQGVWRTGSYARNEHVKDALYLEAEDEIVGFLYLGKAACGPIKRPGPDPEDFFEHWD